MKNLPADTGQFGLFVAFEPADVALYKTLLPRNFTMPENPEVSLVIVDYTGLVPKSGEAPGYFQRFVYEGGDSYIKKF